MADFETRASKYMSNHPPQKDKEDEEEEDEEDKEEEQGEWRRGRTVSEPLYIYIKDNQENKQY